MASFRALGNRLALVDYMRWQGTFWWEDEGYDLAEQFSGLSSRGYPASVVNKGQIKLLEPYLH